METRSPFHFAAGSGTVKIWQSESGYRIFSLADLSELPPRAHGVFVLLREERGSATVIAMDVLTQYNSPAKTIDRVAHKKEIEPGKPTSVAFLALPNWEVAVAENLRLREFYCPSLMPALRG